MFVHFSGGNLLVYANFDHYQFIILRKKSENKLQHSKTRHINCSIKKIKCRFAVQKYFVMSSSYGSK